MCKNTFFFEKKKTKKQINPQTHVIKVTNELKKYGDFGTQFWMDELKSHCYVIYASKKQGIQCKEGLHGIHFPLNMDPIHAGKLSVRYVLETEALKHINQPNPRIERQLRAKLLVAQKEQELRQQLLQKKRKSMDFSNNNNNNNSNLNDNTHGGFQVNNNDVLGLPDAKRRKGNYKLVVFDLTETNSFCIFF